MKGARYSETVDRLLAATKSKTETDLAAALGVKPQSVSQAKKKDSIPAQWFVRVALKYGVSVDWLVAGHGPMPQQTVETKDGCARCMRLEKELEQERENSRRKDGAIIEGFKKIDENGQLRLENLKLQMHLETARKMCNEYAELLKKHKRDAPAPQD